MKAVYAAVFLVVAMPLAANAEIIVGKKVPADQRVSLAGIDHSAWNLLLRKYVDTQGKVDYTGWKASRSDQQALDNYLAHLSTGTFSKRASKEAQLAFWINAYNAVTVKGILREYPTSSIRNHTAKLFGYNIWHDLLLIVDDGQYSLDTIEHKILRKLGEPRIHFAIVCASISCPSLRNEAYTVAKLEQQLADNARSFFANPGNFHYDPAGGRFQLSSILDWFGEDFGETSSRQLTAIAPYLPTPAARKAAATGKGSLSYLSYDWGLNDQAKR